MEVRMNWKVLVIAFLSIGGLLVSPVLSQGPSPVKTALSAFLAGRVVEENLKIEYNDIHGLWGGEFITLDGAGHYYRKQVEHGGKTTEARNNISRSEIDKVVNIVLEVEAWVQIAPSAAPFPDESRATLKISVGSDTAMIWERYNELLKNHRVGRIKDALRVIGERK